MDVEESDLELDGQPLHFRLAGPLRGAQPLPLYLHGLPGDGGDWRGLLERTGGLAPDLPGFGRSGKGGHLQYTPRALAGSVVRLLDHLEIPRFRVAAHGWGTEVARELAAAQGERVDGCALFSPPAPTALADWLARPVIGELLMGSSSRRLMRRWYRRGFGGAEGFSQERIDEVWQAFDQGTQRAILRLVRGTPTAATGVLPGRVLVIEGTLDPWRGSPGGAADRKPHLSGAEHLSFPTGHWPWLHEAAADRACEFLAGAG